MATSTKKYVPKQQSQQSINQVTPDSFYETLRLLEKKREYVDEDLQKINEKLRSIDDLISKLKKFGEAIGVKNEPEPSKKVTFEEEPQKEEPSKVEKTKPTEHLTRSEISKLRKKQDVMDKMAMLNVKKSDVPTASKKGEPTVKEMKDYLYQFVEPTEQQEPPPKKESKPQKEAAKPLPEKEVEDLTEEKIDKMTVKQLTETLGLYDIQKKDVPRADGSKGQPRASDLREKLKEVALEEEEEEEEDYEDASEELEDEEEEDEGPEVTPYPEKGYGLDEYNHVYDLENEVVVGQLSKKKEPIPLTKKTMNNLEELGIEYEKMSAKALRETLVPQEEEEEEEEEYEDAAEEGYEEVEEDEEDEELEDDEEELEETEEGGDIDKQFRKEPNITKDTFRKYFRAFQAGNISRTSSSADIAKKLNIDKEVAGHIHNNLNKYKKEYSEVVDEIQKQSKQTGQKTTKQQTGGRKTLKKR